MNSAESDSSLPDAKVERLINDYFDRRQAGESLTPESFAAEHPDQAEALRPYLKGLSFLDRVRASAGPHVETAGSVGSGTEAGGSAGSSAGAPISVGAPADLPAIDGFELLEEIGRGGMGVVYRALQQSTKRVVALKVMLAGPFASESAMRRFDREVELAARLQHPAVVRVLESGKVGGRKYYAMDYVAGQRLDRWLDDRKPDVRETLRLFEHLCEAVHDAHGHGVVHRDLKPANVLVDDDGRPHILDFGLAKATDQGDAREALTVTLSSPGEVMGTLAYLSPEQAAGKNDLVDARTDVYALGVTLFEALTGSRPFDTRGRASEVLERIVEAPPIRPSSVSDDVDDELETIILKVLEKRQEDRYATAADLGADVRRYLAGEPIVAKRRSGFYVVRKKLVKHRWRVGAAALLLLAIVAGVVERTVSRRQALERARYSARGIQHSLESDHIDVALTGAQGLLARYPELPEVWLLNAHTLHRTEERYQSAFDTLQRALSREALRDWHWAFRLLLAEFYRAGGELARADRLQSQADAEMPDTAEAWYLRSFATTHRDRDRQFKGVLAYVQNAVDRDPQHILAWTRLAHLRLRTADLDGAMAAADRLIALGGSVLHWTRFKGHVLARLHRYEDAIRTYTRVISMSAEQDARFREDVVYWRAHVYRRNAAYARALEDYSALARRWEDNASKLHWVHYHRAAVLWMLGRREEAAEDYRAFRESYGRPFYADARRYLLLRELGRDAEAKLVLDGAIEYVQDPWRKQITACLAGRIAPEELVAAAGEDAFHRCEGCYYAGETSLAAGRPDRARHWFAECVKTGVVFDVRSFPFAPMNEYDLAEWRLATLEGPDAADSPNAPGPRTP